MYHIALKAVGGKSISAQLGRIWTPICCVFFSYSQPILAYTVRQQSSRPNFLCKINLPDEKEESAKSLSLNSTVDENSFSEGFDVMGNLLRFLWLNKGTERQPVQKKNSFRSAYQYFLVKMNK